MGDVANLYNGRKVLIYMTAKSIKTSFCDILLHFGAPFPFPNNQVVLGSYLQASVR